MTLAPLTSSISLDSRLRKVVRIHFDPDSGTPYWLRRERERNLDARRQIRSIDDLHLLGPMDEDALRDLPVEELVPRSEWKNRVRWIVAETGGTLGHSKFAVHRDDEFEAAFVTPFREAALRVRFPRLVNWLYIGPSGPHIIGKAARACAAALDSPDPFTADFDPRWAKKLPDDSFSRRRYLQHVVDQSLRILHRQRIGVIFATPPVLLQLSGALDEERCGQIRGIHFGGMALDPESRETIARAFPAAVLLSGYGNTLFGVSPELRYSPADGIDYYPGGSRLVYRVIPLSGEPDSVRIRQSVEYGVRGQVMGHRLDETQLIANLVERDTAIRIPTLRLPDSDFDGDGLRDPRPLQTASIQPNLGLY